MNSCREHDFVHVIIEAKTWLGKSQVVVIYCRKCGAHQPLATAGTLDSEPLLSGDEDE